MSSVRAKQQETARAEEHGCLVQSCPETKAERKEHPACCRNEPGDPEELRELEESREPKEPVEPEESRDPEESNEPGASAAETEASTGGMRSEQTCACLEVQDGREGRHETRSCCGCSRHKHRSEKEYKDLLNRLSRIEGQIRGIKGMVEKDAYCPDILIQVAAAGAALNSFSKVLLASHIRSCVAEDIREGKDGTVDELVTVLQKLMK